MSYYKTMQVDSFIPNVFVDINDFFEKNIDNINLEDILKNLFMILRFNYENSLCYNKRLKIRRKNDKANLC